MRHPDRSAPRAGRRPTPAAVAAIAASLVAAVATPAGAQQMVNELEASVRLGFELETEPDTSIAFQDFGSRIRWNGERRISDDLVGLGYLEFGFDDGDRIVEGVQVDGGISATRYAYIGVAAPFGTVTGGKQYRAFYDAVTSVVDVAYVGSCLYELSCSRQSGVIKYERALGEQLRLVASTTLVDGDVDDDFVDEIEAGAIVDLGGINVGAGLTIGNDGGETALRTSEDTGVALGVAASTELREDLTVSATLQFASDDYLGGPDDGFGVTVAGVADRFYGLVSVADAENTPFYATLGYEYPIDDDALIYAEVQGVETDEPGEDFEVFLRSVFVYNFGSVSGISRER